MREQVADNEPVIFGHSLERQIGRQLSAGLVLTDLNENGWTAEGTLLDRHVTTRITTHAVKCSPEPVR